MKEGLNINKIEEVKKNENNQEAKEIGIKTLDLNSPIMKSFRETTWHKQRANNGLGVKIQPELVNPGSNYDDYEFEVNKEKSQDAGKEYENIPVGEIIYDFKEEMELPLDGYNAEHGYSYNTYTGDYYPDKIDIRFVIHKLNNKLYADILSKEYYSKNLNRYEVISISEAQEIFKNKIESYYKNLKPSEEGVSTMGKSYVSEFNSVKKNLKKILKKLRKFQK